MSTVVTPAPAVEAMRAVSPGGSAGMSLGFAGSLAALRMGSNGAMLTIAGIVLSGPLGLGLVSLVHPSSAWQGAEVFARHFHWIQTVPFFGGFALVFGYVMLFAGIYHLADASRRPVALVAVISTTAFTTLIFFNYICQTTFIPALATAYRPEHEAIISTFSLANPLSLAWAVEMWGYAFLGVATWATAGIFDRNRLERAAGAFMVLNGVVSILGAFVTSLDLGWVLTLPGVIGYVAWNALVLVLSILLLLVFRQRRAEQLRRVRGARDVPSGHEPLRPSRVAVG